MVERLSERLIVERQGNQESEENFCSSFKCQITHHPNHRGRAFGHHIQLGKARPVPELAQPEPEKLPNRQPRRQEPLPESRVELKKRVEKPPRPVQIEPQQGLHPEIVKLPLPPPLPRPHALPHPPTHRGPTDHPGRPETLHHNPSKPRGKLQRSGHCVPRRGVHNSRIAPDRHHPLGDPRERTSHRDQALLVFHYRFYPYPEMP
ncbi:Titin [Striga asiatica]|uniref:Titin n=1 Tax=Striga asiatica TaxID=4170 RepID=A0A5A7PVD8_STRAF|nr:Titin [Striga asiatica]